MNDENTRRSCPRVCKEDLEKWPYLQKRIGYSAEDFLAGLAIVGAMAVDAEKEGRFIPAQEILKEIQKSKTDN